MGDVFAQAEEEGGEPEHASARPPALKPRLKIGGAERSACPPSAKQILERAIAQGPPHERSRPWRHRAGCGTQRKKAQGRLAATPQVEELAIEKGYLTMQRAGEAATAHRAGGFRLSSREIAGYKLIEKIGAGTMGNGLQGQAGLARPGRRHQDPEPAPGAQGRTTSSASCARRARSRGSTIPTSSPASTWGSWRACATS